MEVVYFEEDGDGNGGGLMKLKGWWRLGKMEMERGYGVTVRVSHRPWGRQSWEEGGDVGDSGGI